MKALISIILALPLAAASATTITVNTTADNTTAADGQCTLREAVANVNAATDTTSGDCAAGSGAGDTITFTGLTMPAIITLALGQLVVDKDLTINGPGAAQLAIDGNHESRVFFTSGSGSSSPSLTLSGLAVQNGIAPSGGGIAAGNLNLTDCTVNANSGGGVDVAGVATLTNCTLSGNIGTGVYVRYGATAALQSCTLSGNTSGIGIDGAATLTDCTLSGNSDRGIWTYTFGTAVLRNCMLTGNSSGAVLNDSFVQLIDCTLSGNTTDFDGGAIYNFGIADLRNSTLNNNSAGRNGGAIFGGRTHLINCTLSGNTAGGDGGAIDGEVMLTDSTLSDNSAGGNGGAVSGSAVVSNCTVSGNTAGGAGGGIYGAGFTALRLTNSTLNNNSAGRNGGGIASDFLTELTNCTLSGNSAISGGGAEASGAATLTNCTLSGNSASDSGGGIFFLPVADNFRRYLRGGNKARITNCTLTGNTAATAGGGIFNGGKIVRLKSTILANNAPGGNCAGVRLNGHGGRNLEDGSSCGFSGAGCAHRSGGSFCNTDPKLDPGGLANNGGPTQTIAVQPDSPAIYAGLRCPPTDQRTFARPGLGSTNKYRCTIGAYEFDSPSCRTGQTLCTDTCADLPTDPNNCGVCGTVCEAGQQCRQGMCF